MQWDGVTPDQYEVLRRTTDWEGNIPTGGILHVSSFSDSGLRVTDIWESEHEMNNFVQNRLMPSVMQAGIQTQPNVVVTPVHAIFSPRPERLV